MNNEKGRKKKAKGRDSDMFEMTMKDLLIQIFKNEKRNIFEKGAFAAAMDIRNNIAVLASISKNRDMSSIFMDLTNMTLNLDASRDEITKKLSKEELQKLNEFSEECINAVSSIIDSLESFEFIENDVVQGEEFFQEIEKSSVIVPPAEREEILSELPRIIQRGFYRAVHEELPKLMEDFFENILDAIERESIEDMQEILETEKLKWLSFGLGFP